MSFSGAPTAASYLRKSLRERDTLNPREQFNSDPGLPAVCVGRLLRFFEAKLVGGVIMTDSGVRSAWEVGRREEEQGRQGRGGGGSEPLVLFATVMRSPRGGGGRGPRPTEGALNREDDGEGRDGPHSPAAH